MAYEVQLQPPRLQGEGWGEGGFRLAGEALSRCRYPAMVGDNRVPMHTSSDNETGTPIAAGDFGQWLAQARAALHGTGGMDVPCGECVGCCTSHYSILLRPHDAALDIVPVKFLSSVKGLAYPHAKMNPLENGHCPMFKEGRCSIYAQRPQTCLDYDCRVFAAAGMQTGDNRPVINQRIRQWRFTYASEADRQAHAAVQSAAAFIIEHGKAFPAGWLPDNPSGIAVLAIKVYGLFLDTHKPVGDDIDLASAVVKASRDFDAGKIG